MIESRDVSRAISAHGSIASGAKGFNESLAQMSRADAQQLAMLLDSAPQLLWMASGDGQFLYCNSNLRWLLGAVVGHPVEQIIPEKLLQAEDRERWLDIWRRSMTSGCSYEVEYRACADRDGAVHWFLERGMRLDHLGIPDRWLVIATQIDEPKRHEEELLGLLRSKQRFFATLLHELRNPLAPIANAIEMLARHANDPPVVSSAGKVIQRQLHQITRLVDDLIDMSRIARTGIGLQKRRIDLRDVVDAAIETARPSIEARAHQLVMHIPAWPIVIEADSVRLRQVVTNLLINAAKYTHPGGRICIALGTIADVAVVSVRDNGIGISAELLPKVFDLFVRAASEHDADTGGMGVGLAVARELVELHGGSLSAHSDGPGKGSEFTITLPMAASGALDPRRD
jgi:PAS domain S-box-containing protein